MNQDSPEAVWNLQWRHLFGTRTVAEVKYSGLVGLLLPRPRGDPGRATYDGTSGRLLAGRGHYYYADRGRNQVNASISHYAEAFGKHDLKFGVEIERSKVQSRYGYNQGLLLLRLHRVLPKGQYYAYTYGYDTDGRNQRESSTLRTPGSRPSGSPSTPASGSTSSAAGAGARQDGLQTTNWVPASASPST